MKKIMNSLSVKTIGILFLSLIFNAFFSEVFLAKTSSNYKNNYQQFTGAIAQEKTYLHWSSFTLKNYSIEHQGKNTLDIRVNYWQKENKKYATIFQEQALVRQIDQLIFNYPNETDFWEIINCQLTKKLLDQNPNLSAISMTINVYPNQAFPYYRASTVTRTADGKIEESWHFDFRSQSMEKVGENLAKINVNYTYKSDAFFPKYPDFIPIYKQIEDFFANYAYRGLSWGLVHRKLVQILLQENPKISSLSLELEELK